MKNNDIKFETLKRPIRKKFIIGSVVLVAIVSAITLTTSRAKFRLTQSIPVVRGKIYYYNGDLNVMAMYKQKDGSTCTEDSCYDELSETTRMPTGNYAINEQKSYCKVIDTVDPDAKLYSKYVDGEYVHIMKNLRKKDKCYLYFDKVTGARNATELLAMVKSKSNGVKSSFNITATTNEGIFEVYDPMYGPNAKSYYWRGAVTDNHVIFANHCWRIIRINGDGTIRMIYNGELQGTKKDTCLGNGTNGENVEIGKSAFHATDYDKSYYVGWTYSDSQRPSESINDGIVGTTNTIKKIVEDWYKTNITDKGYDTKVANAIYCNDRDVTEPPSAWRWNNTYITYWNIGSTSTIGRFVYATSKRVFGEHEPTIKCNNDGDVYKIKIGLITADEAMCAGGTVDNNVEYWLNTNSAYWTMSPAKWDAAGYEIIIQSYGQIVPWIINDSNGGVRPVINLSTDATFNQNATGEATSPYIVQ